MIHDSTDALRDDISKIAARRISNHIRRKDMKIGGHINNMNKNWEKNNE